uniref:Transmembrane protein n=1 Tax=Heterorhabditis bacteriophora TaxID=37862 RepID=A0A1I7XQB3_HETBA
MHTIDLTHYMSLRDSGCDIIPSQIRCFALRLPMTVTMYLAYSSTFMASIERYIATTRLATYESNRIAGHFLIGGQEMKESLLDRRSDLVSICIMARLYQVRENLRSMLALDQFLITSCLFSTVCIFIRGILPQVTFQHLPWLRSGHQYNAVN